MLFGAWRRPLRLNVTVSKSCIFTVWEHLSEPQQAHIATFMHWNHVFSAVGLLITVLWNIAAPIRAWYYGRYGFSVSEISVNKAVTWDFELDLDVAVRLYQSAGVDVSTNLPKNGSVRILNVILDFMVYKKSTHWAHLVNKHEVDPLVGRQCRTSMRYRPKELDEAMATINGSQDIYWGGPTFEYVEEQETCFVGEVAEAVLCIKGYNASDLLNLDWTTTLDPADPEVDAGLKHYQSILMPDLSECLARRAALINSASSFDEAVQVLLSEIARNYSLLPHNRAGEKNLMQPVTIETGFVDVSGAMSGRRVVQLVGHMPPFARDGGPYTTKLVREQLWVCAYDKSYGFAFYDCIDWNTLAYPGLATADFMWRWFVPIENSIRFKKTRMFGSIQGYEYINEQPVNDPVEYLTESDIVPPSMYKGLTLEAAYRDFVDRAVFEDLYGKERIDAVWARGSEMMTVRCMVQHGCFDSCPSIANGLDYYLAYNALVGGSCTVLKLQLPIDINPIVSKKCLGIGRGNSSLVYVALGDGRLRQATGALTTIINNTASPFEILACMLGGRVPGTRQNAVLSDDLAPAIEAAPNLMLTQSLTHGSELLFINFFSIMSLIGSTVFAFSVTRQLVRLFAIVRSCHSSVATQVHFSVCESNISVNVWERHHSFLRAFAFASLMCWYIGAVNSRCSWFVDGQDLWEISTNDDKADVLNSTTSPVYKCHPGDAMGMFRDRAELVRLFGASYTVFALTFLGPKVGSGNGSCLRGAAQHPPGCVVVLFTCGLVPILLMSWAVTGLNTWRINTHSLTSVHNQVFIMVLWMTGLLLLNALRNKWCNHFVSPLLSVVGLRQQHVVDFAQLDRFLRSDHYYVQQKHYRHEKASAVRLSVLLECSHFDVDRDVSLPSRDSILPQVANRALTSSCSSVGGRKGIAVIPAPDARMCEQATRSTDEFMIQYAQAVPNSPPTAQAVVEAFKSSLRGTKGSQPKRAASRHRKHSGASVGNLSAE